MSNKQQRQQNHNNWHRLMEKVRPARQCSNCLVWHRDGGHFIPPSLGGKGFFICKKVTP